MRKFAIEKMSQGVKFTLKADNGEKIATSEVYSSQAQCLRGIASMRKSAALEKIADLTEGENALTNPKFELYQDKRGQYRFRLKARNGQVVAFSEGYTTKGACLQGIQSVIKCAKDAAIEE